MAFDAPPSILLENAGRVEICITATLRPMNPQLMAALTTAEITAQTEQVLEANVTADIFLPMTGKIMAKGKPHHTLYKEVPWEINPTDIMYYTKTTKSSSYNMPLLWEFIVHLYTFVALVLCKLAASPGTFQLHKANCMLRGHFWHLWLCDDELFFNRYHSHLIKMACVILCKL